jgi:predicted nucleic acid-binding protein
VGVMSLDSRILVLDNSAAMSLIMPDEREHPDAIRLERTILQKDIVVPKLWQFEFANALNMGIKRNRINLEHIHLFKAQIDLLDIQEDKHSTALESIIELAQTYKITTYDATYLELAIRRNAILATNDKQLKTAAIRAGIITI